ncbi:MAG: hypothetical protein C0502_05485 [Opitutus sp.]|nr:hypothetical protein [Opitutus sp.]
MSERLAWTRRGPQFHFHMLAHDLVRGAAFVVVLMLAVAARAAKWPAVNPAELAATKSAIEPDAGVEILAREVTIDAGNSGGARTDVYMRLKVFTKAGAEKLAKVELTYDKANSSITDLEARTIKPDGTILELKGKEIYDREFVRVGSLRGRMKSFAPPGLEPGAIVEYRYRLRQDGWLVFYSFLFPSEYPSRSVLFRYSPPPIPGLSMQVLFLNYPARELKSDRAGFYEFPCADVTSHKEEPFQPPALHLWPGLTIYFRDAPKENPDLYWAALAEKLFATGKSQARATKAITLQAQKIVAATDSDDEKLRKLHDFCRSRIVNRARAATGLWPDQKGRLPANDDAADTLKHLSGTPEDINTLFTALARAAGFDARLALANDRSVFVHNPKLPVPFSLNHRVAAVRRGTAWQYFDPGATYLPAGMLDWRHGDTDLLVSSEQGANPVRIASADADLSVHHRTARLAVGDDGSMEGDVTVEVSGYYEAAEKRALDAATPDEVEKHILATLEPHLKGVEVSAIKLENAASPLEPLKLTYHLRVPEYAERTGARLFVQPSVFRRNGKPLFEAATRENMIVFPHRYREIDNVRMTLPTGAQIEAGSSPENLDLGKAGAYAVNITWRPVSRVVTYRREFKLNSIMFPAESYRHIKGLFEVIQERDNHTLTFLMPAADEAAGKP